MAQNLSHTIKGVAGNLSAKTLYTAALELEQGIRQRQAAMLPALLKDLGDALEEVLESARKVI